MVSYLNLSPVRRILLFFFNQVWHRDLGCFVRRSCCTGSVRKSRGKVKKIMNQSSGFTIEVNWLYFIEKLLQASAHTYTRFECLQTFNKEVSKRQGKSFILTGFIGQAYKKNISVWIVIVWKRFSILILPSSEILNQIKSVFQLQEFAVNDILRVINWNGSLRSEDTETVYPP